MVQGIELYFQESMVRGTGRGDLQHYLQHLPSDGSRHWLNRGLTGAGNGRQIVTCRELALVDSRLHHCPLRKPSTTGAHHLAVRSTTHLPRHGADTAGRAGDHEWFRNEPGSRGGAFRSHRHRHRHHHRHQG